jgi:hypothetical protein
MRKIVIAKKWLILKEAYRATVCERAACKVAFWDHFHFSRSPRGKILQNTSFKW